MRYALGTAVACVEWCGGYLDVDGFGVRVRCAVSNSVGLRGAVCRASTIRNRHGDGWDELQEKSQGLLVRVVPVDQFLYGLILHVLNSSYGQ